MEHAASDSGAMHRDGVRKSISAGASFTLTYAVMNALATVIACYGLLADSTAVVIGAMVVALLLGPIAGVGLALVDYDLPLLRKSLLAELLGVVIVMGTALIIGLLHADIPLGREILSRTQPTTGDLSVALASGIAAAVATVRPSVSLALVGVAISTALVPPLATCSMLLARGANELAYGAFLLAFTNMVAIQFSSSVVFWVAGYSRTAGFWSAGSRVLLRNLLSVVLLLMLAAVLGLSGNRAVRNLLFEAKVRNTLHEQLNAYPGAYLADVRFGKVRDETVVSAVIRIPSHLTAQDVGTMERQLPAAPDGSKIALRVRRVGVEVMTSKGPSFQSEAPSMTSPDEAINYFPAQK
jgi:uncharacterized hydrophobic protein (TIGR00271 family)